MMTGNRPMQSTVGVYCLPVNAAGLATSAPGGGSFSLPTWVEVVASAPENLLVVGVQFRGTQGSVLGENVILLATGAAAAETQISVLSCGSNQTNGSIFERDYNFPFGIFVASGTRISVAYKATSNNASLNRPTNVKLKVVGVASLIPA